MRKLKYLVIFLLIGLSTPAPGAISVENIPPDSVWYFHADLVQMRTSPAGKPLYGWLQDEVLADIREDAGIDLDKEADTITAFATPTAGIVLVIDGHISQVTKDKLLAMGAATGSLNKLGAGDKAYYFIKGDRQHHENAAADGADAEGHHNNIDIDLESFEDGAYFSFAAKNKLIVTSTEAQMQSLLEKKGRIAVGKSQKGTLIVLGADRSLMQAGMKADEFGKRVNWDSNILRNTEQAAVLVADAAGKLAIEAQLVTTEKEMAESLASIVRGLISLQIFNEDIDEDIGSFLQATKVDVNDKTLIVRVELDPQVVVDTLE
jgi:hypothetical protein